MDKVVLAGRVIIFKIIRIQKAWRRWLQERQFIVFLNDLRWETVER